MILNIGSPDKYRGSLLLDIMSPFAHTLRHAVLIQIYFRVFKAGLLQYWSQNTWVIRPELLEYCAQITRVLRPNYSSTAPKLLEYCAIVLWCSTEIGCPLYLSDEPKSIPLTDKFYSLSIFYGAEYMGKSAISSATETKCRIILHRHGIWEHEYRKG